MNNLKKKKLIKRIIINKKRRMMMMLLWRYAITRHTIIKELYWYMHLISLQGCKSQAAKVATFSIKSEVHPLFTFLFLQILFQQLFHNLGMKFELAFSSVLWILALQFRVHSGSTLQLDSLQRIMVLFWLVVISKVFDLHV